MAADNRLSREQLAALTPGDPVTIETPGDLRRPKLTTGTVVRVEGSYVIVSVRSPRGIPYVDRYSRRDGLRVGGGRPAELVDAEAVPSGLPVAERRTMRVDAAYRAWSRNRGDVAKLRDLQAAISEALGETLVQP